LTIGSVPSALVPSNAAAWFSGLSLVGSNTLSIASATFTDLNKKSYKKGLTIEGNVQTTSQFPAQTQLQQATHTSSAVTGTITAVFPLQSSDPLAQFTIVLDTPIYFGNSQDIKVSNAEVNVQVSQTNPDATLDAVITFTNVGGASSPLVFKVAADLSESEISFSGALQGNFNMLQCCNRISKITS
jgi:hypothetical protein